MLDCLITVLKGQTPVAGADVALVARNGTYIHARTDEQGNARLRLPDSKIGTLLVAHADAKGEVDANFMPQDHAQVRLSHSKGAGSVIFLQSTGQIPGLLGRLNPILDTANRTYIYGDNLSFNDQAGQPFPFEKGKPFMAEDAMRHRFKVTVVEAIGRTFLLNFERQDH